MYTCIHVSTRACRPCESHITKHIHKQTYIEIYIIRVQVAALSTHTQVLYTCIHVCTRACRRVHSPVNITKHIHKQTHIEIFIICMQVAAMSAPAPAGMHVCMLIFVHCMFCIFCMRVCIYQSAGCIGWELA